MIEYADQLDQYDKSITDAKEKMEALVKSKNEYIYI